MDPLLRLLRMRNDVENAMIAAVDWSTLIQVREAMTPVADLERALERAVRERIDEVMESPPQAPSE